MKPGAPSRGQLPKAYLRIDPNIDQAFPELRNTFVGLMCSAARQSHRGRYRDLKTVEALHSKAFVRRSLDRGDLVLLPDGRVYLDGWDEWQEGDHTVGERQNRIRSKRSRVVTQPLRERASTVTPPLPDRAAPSEAVRQQGSKAEGTDSGSSADRGEVRTPVPKNGTPLTDCPRCGKAFAVGANKAGGMFCAKGRGGCGHGWVPRVEEPEQPGIVHGLPSISSLPWYREEMERRRAAEAAANANNPPAAVGEA